MRHLLVSLILLLLLIPCRTVSAEKNGSIGTPLWFERCSFSAVQHLLRNKNFDPNEIYLYEDYPDSAEFTPLMHAVLNPDYRVAEELIKNGASVTYETSSLNRFNALVCAMDNPDIRMLKLLERYGADLKYYNKSMADDSRGTTLLSYAASNPNPGIFRYLLKKGANPFIREDLGGDSVLMRCAMYNANPKVIELLLQSGFKIDDTNDFGQTAATLAIEYNKNPEVIRIFIESGADLCVVAGVEERKNVLQLADLNDALKKSPVFNLLKQKYAEQIKLKQKH